MEDTATISKSDQNLDQNGRQKREKLEMNLREKMKVGVKSLVFGKMLRSTLPFLYHLITATNATWY